MLRQLVVILLSMLLAVSLYELIRQQFTQSHSKTAVHHDLILEEILQIGKLELVKYQVKDIVEIRQSEVNLLESLLIDASLYNPSRALLIISGEIVACIDLKKIKHEDIIENNNRIIIRLPEPEICYTRIDHSRSRLYDLHIGAFSGVNSSVLLQTAYQEAEKKLEQAARQSKLLDQCRQSAQHLLKPILQRLSNKSIVLTYASLQPQQETLP